MNYISLLDKDTILINILRVNTIIKTSEFYGIIITKPERVITRKLSGSYPCIKFKLKIIAPNPLNEYFDHDYTIGEITEIDESVSYIIRNWSIVED